jgi:hypothetical protein
MSPRTRRRHLIALESNPAEMKIVTRNPKSCLMDQLQSYQASSDHLEATHDTD